MRGWGAGLVLVLCAGVVRPAAAVYISPTGAAIANQLGIDCTPTTDEYLATCETTTGRLELATAASVLDAVAGVVASGTCAVGDVPEMAATDCEDLRQHDGNNDCVGADNPADCCTGGSPGTGNCGPRLSNGVLTVRSLVLEQTTAGQSRKLLEAVGGANYWEWQAATSLAANYTITLQDGGTVAYPGGASYAGADGSRRLDVTANTSGATMAAIAAGDARLYPKDAANGTPQWRMEAPESDAAILHGTLFVRTADVSLTGASADLSTITLANEIPPAGRVYVVRTGGSIRTDDATDTLDYQVTLGGAVVCDTGALNLTSDATTTGFAAEFVLTVRTAGASATVQCNGTFEANDAVLTNGRLVERKNTTTIDLDGTPDVILKTNVVFNDASGHTVVEETAVFAVEQ